MSTRPIREKISGTNYNSTLDNTHLAEHLRPDASMPPALLGLCNKSTVQGHVGGPAVGMTQCLQAWNALPTVAQTPIFEDSIAQNPRFIFVPQFHSTSWGPGNHWQPILTFRAAYIDTIWFNCNGSFNSKKTNEVCDGSKGRTFEPDAAEAGNLLGSGPSAPANCAQLRLDQFTAFLLPHGAVVSEDVLALYPNQLRGPFDTQLTR